MPCISIIFIWTKWCNYIHSSKIATFTRDIVSWSMHSFLHDNNPSKYDKFTIKFLKWHIVYTLDFIWEQKHNIDNSLDWRKLYKTRGQHIGHKKINYFELRIVSTRSLSKHVRKSHGGFVQGFLFRRVWRYSQGLECRSLQNQLNITWSQW